MPQTATPLVTIDRSAKQDEPLLEKLKALLSIDFEDHDTRLLQCVYAAKTRIEKITGVLLDTATVTVRWGAFYDYEPLPNGPVTGDVLVTDLAGTVLTVDGLGVGFPSLVGDYPKGIKLVYPAGYDANTLPEDLQEAVLNLAANLFDSGTRNWKDGVMLHRQYTWAS